MLVIMSLRSSTKYGKSSRRNRALYTMFSLDKDDSKTPPSISTSRVIYNADRLYVFYVCTEQSVIRFAQFALSVGRGRDRYSFAHLNPKCSKACATPGAVSYRLPAFDDHSQ